MITDYAENLHLYKELNEYADMMLNFIKRQQEEALPDGDRIVFKSPVK